jgi:hypothetical protein
MEPNKRQKIKIPFDYDKDMFNLFIGILNYYKYKQLVEGSGDYKYFRYINPFYKSDNLNNDNKRFYEFIYLSHARYLYVKSRLSKVDVGVILFMFNILYSNKEDGVYPKLNYELNECEEYYEMSKIDGLDTTKCWECEYYDSKYDKLEVKYMKIYIKHIKSINELYSDIMESDKIECLHSNKGDFSEEYKSNFIKYEQKGYLIEEIIDLFEYVDK